MKTNIFFALLLFALVSVMIICASGKPKENTATTTVELANIETFPKIYVIRNGELQIGGMYQIVSVDGHLYLAGDHGSGGIVHLESCPCKTK